MCHLKFCRVSLVINSASPKILCLIYNLQTVIVISGGQAFAILGNDINGNPRQ